MLGAIAYSLLSSALVIGSQVAPTGGALSNIAPIYSFSSAAQDHALASVRRLDRDSRAADGTLIQLSVSEHLRRAKIYLTNRAFDEARAHYKALIARYPNVPDVSAALYGIGRAHFLEHTYAEAVPPLEQLASGYANTRDGRDGLYQLGLVFLRMGRAAEAATKFREYTERYPAGEKIEAAYLNVIDSLREAGSDAEAVTWVARTRERFRGTAADTNALFARLRLEVAAGDWTRAVASADELRRGARFTKDVMTNLDEVAYLRAYSLEQAGRRAEAVGAYTAIPDKLNSYYGALATKRLQALGGESVRGTTAARAARVREEAVASSQTYPAPYRETIVRAATSRKVDPRLVLAIMRQESQFQPRAKSPVAARGLLQFTFDTASKYAPRVGLTNLNEEDLYRPDVSILLGGEYLADLFRMFPDFPEAVIASYNGGEDNVARWIKRGRQRDPGVFTSEVGFSETKNYVYKVMSNYRAYQQLYTSDLRSR